MDIQDIIANLQLALHPEGGTITSLGSWPSSLPCFEGSPLEGFAKAVKAGRQVRLE